MHIMLCAAPSSATTLRPLTNSSILNAIYQDYGITGIPAVYFRTKPNCKLRESLLDVIQVVACSLDIYFEYYAFYAVLQTRDTKI